MRHQLPKCTNHAPVLLAPCSGLVHRQRRLDHLVLADLGHGLVGADLCGKQALQLRHGGRNNVLVALADPVLGRGKYQLQHTALVVGILFARGRHVCIHRQQRRSAKQQVVNSGQLAVKPDVDVDDWHALEAIKLLEKRLGTPLIREQLLDNVHCEGTHRWMMKC